MIRVRMSDEDRIEPRQITNRNPGGTHSGQKTTEVGIEVGVRKEDTVSQFN